MKIVIADDHALFRDSLRSLVESRGIEVVGEASNGNQAIELARRLQPDVVLMDLAMPEMSGAKGQYFRGDELSNPIHADLKPAGQVAATASR